MRKLVLFNLISMDGLFEGPNSDINWHNVDEEFNDFAVQQLDSAGALLFGRKTYQMMAGYWPMPSAIETDPETANRMNSLPKFVFSKTLERADWKNTSLIAGDASSEIKRLKEQPGKDLYLFGSANLASTLTRLGLIDEYRLLINPLILGFGVPMFKNLDEKIDLKLLQARTFKNENVLLFYERLR